MIVYLKGVLKNVNHQVILTEFLMFQQLLAGGYIRRKNRDI